MGREDSEWPTRVQTSSPRVSVELPQVPQGSLGILAVRGGVHSAVAPVAPTCHQTAV